MTILGGVLGCVFFLMAFGVFSMSQSAIHEGLSALLVVCGLLCFVMAMLGDVCRELRKVQKAILQQPPPTPPSEALPVIAELLKAITDDVEFIKKAKAAEILRRKQERQET